LAADVLGNRKFNLTYGFYVIMGGFVVDYHIGHESYRVTITSNAVTYLAEQGHFLDISPETISDKSKANLIGKALICVQVTWMMTQCIARKLAGYPLSLLEVHTMVHVVCALMLYVFWYSVSLTTLVLLS